MERKQPVWTNCHHTAGELACPPPTALLGLASWGPLELDQLPSVSGNPTVAECVIITPLSFFAIGNVKLLDRTECYCTECG